MSRIKVVHISCYDIGGAAKAALRLDEGLLNEGVDSKFICLNKHGFEKKVIQFNRRKPLNILQRVVQKLGLPVQKDLKNKKKVKKFSENFEIFTFPETDINLLDCQTVKEADIIHLHWVDHYLDYPSFFKNVNKPVVWTLHDKNPTMGGFHLLLDKDRNPEMALLEETILEKKIKWIHQYHNIHIVSPSKFLLNYSINSKTFNNYPHYYIPNSVDLEIFKPHNKVSAKKIFYLQLEKKIVLFFNIKGFHKGSDIVFECIRTTFFKNIHFVALGEPVNTEIPNVSFIKSTSDERLLSIIYSAADAFLLPSREDNLPNMMLESLACGTPVLATPIGGIIDTIETGLNGILSTEVSVSAIRKILIEFDNGNFNFDSTLIRSFAVQNFDLSIQAKKYIKLYSDILS